MVWTYCGAQKNLGFILCLLAAKFLPRIIEDRISELEPHIILELLRSHKHKSNNAMPAQELLLILRHVKRCNGQYSDQFDRRKGDP